MADDKEVFGGHEASLFGTVGLRCVHGRDIVPIVRIDEHQSRKIIELMEIANRLHLLKRLYALYEEFGQAYQPACRKGCALCCTANVTMSSLEGFLIYNHWIAKGVTAPIEALSDAAARPRFQPRMTINHLADLCARDEELPEEAADPEVGRCPLLVDDLCSIYAVRPFGCRAMVSRIDCAKTGYADMPDEVLAANNLVLQFIEAIDVNGLSGNLTDMLLFLSNPEHFGMCERMEKLSPADTLAGNRPIPVLMVPPEHQGRLQPLLHSIQQMLRAHA